MGLTAWTRISLVCWAGVFLVLPLCWRHVAGSLNLFLNQAEVRRLLGLQAELFYVREGVINEYAMNFVVPIPAHIDELHFSWQALSKKPIPYITTLEVSNKEALPEPQLNITRTGVVPTQLQTFQVLLGCSGALSAEVDVVLSINVTLPHAINATPLVFRRKKICLKGQHSPTLNSAVMVNAPESSPSNVIYIAVGCAVAVLFTLIMLLTAWYLRNRKTRRQGEILHDSRNGSSTSQAGHTFMGAETSNHYTSVSSSKSGSGSGSYASFKRLPSYHVSQCTLDEKARDINDTIAELTVERCKIRLKSMVLEGTFGRIYRGTFLEDDGVEVDVMVKTVTECASPVQVALLLQEGLALYGLNQKNIMPVFGVSVEDKVPPFLLYLNQGSTNLKRYLQQCKGSPEGIYRTLTTQEVVAMALQVIQALQFLLRRKLVHRDLAARNCVVDEHLHVRVTDNALSRDLFPNDYHCLGDNENRPVKWLAIESLVHRKFSEASDVWAFGVFLWELTTLAQQPYIEIDPFEMAAYLRDGYRLAQPVNCPDELFAVMAYCWTQAPEERPNFSQLQTYLQEFYMQLTQFV